MKIIDSIINLNEKSLSFSKYINNNNKNTWPQLNCNCAIRWYIILPAIYIENNTWQSGGFMVFTHGVR